MASTMGGATMLPAPGPSTQPLPREIIKWIQSLDLSFAVKNPKRDFANGYLTAEILSRYYLKDIDMNCYENGTRLAAKVDNWEQIYKFCKKKGAKDGIQISKHLIDPVIHCTPGAAEVLVYHLYGMLTRRQVKQFDTMAQAPGQLPPFMRDTASRRMKDPEIARIEDRDSRLIAAIDTLSHYHAERRELKAHEAPMLISKERKVKLGVMEEDLGGPSQQEPMESEQVEEVVVKAMTGEPNQLKSSSEPKESAKPARQSSLVKAVASAPSSAAALATMQQPALFVKPAADIVRPLVASILQESEELSAAMDPRKDLVVSFVEQCQRETVPEDTSVRVFDTLANRAQLLVDTLTKSPPEFWKVWMTFFPAVAAFSESSPVFSSAVNFFKRLGEFMRVVDPALTQHLIAEVGLPSLAKELVRSPEKCESLCEIIYSYAQEDTLSHLQALRSLKEKLSDQLPVYVSCLSHLASQDAQLSLLDEHLLDLYIYYALVGMQSPRPRVRVSGLSILSTITTCSSHYSSILRLLPSFELLTGDEWWEVQAQLLVLCASLLNRIAVPGRHVGIDAEEEDGSQSGSGAQEAEEVGSEVLDGLLGVVSRAFIASGSKSVLQAGLSSLVHVLQDYPTLLPVYVSVLLEQPTELRQRLLRLPSAEGEEGDLGVTRLAYVMGGSSRMYEEKCISALWPHLDVAKTLYRQLDAAETTRFELQHAEVFLASLPQEFMEHEAEEWVGVFEKLSPHIFEALMRPELHWLSAQIIRRFWLSPVGSVAATSAAGCKTALLQALRLVYCEPEGAAVEEAILIQFLRDACGGSEPAAAEVASVVESFRETFPTEYARSHLGELLS